MHNNLSLFIVYLFEFIQICLSIHHIDSIEKLEDP